jgi:uncharacterized protein YjbJ (UPF0337 family)
MASNNSGPEEAIKGVVEGVKGKAKEVIGAVAGRDDLFREGQAQQDKAEAQRDAAQKEAEAGSARTAANETFQQSQNDANSRRLAASGIGTRALILVPSAVCSVASTRPSACTRLTRSPRS